MSDQLKPSEIERLAVLAEELGEVQQVIGKILRFGWESRHPDGGPTNRELLEKELGDVEAALALMNVKRDVSEINIGRNTEIKIPKLCQYLLHQEEGKKA